LESFFVPLGKRTVVKLHGERMEREPDVALSIRNAMVNSVVLFPRDVSGKERRPLSLSPRNAETRNPVELDKEFAAIMQELVLEDIVKPKRNHALLSDPLQSRETRNVNSYHSMVENANVQDVANGPPSASTRDARLLERNAFGEELLLAIDQDATANSNKDPRTVNKEDVVAQRSLVTDVNVSPSLPNVTGLERDSVPAKEREDVTGNKLERMEDKRFAATERPRNADQLELFITDHPNVSVDLLDPQRVLQNKDVATLSENVLETNVSEEEPSADGLEKLLARDVSSRSKEFASDHVLLARDSNVLSLLILISLLLMERNSTKIKVEDSQSTRENHSECLHKERSGVTPESLLQFL
jgi:hypothetical protein